MRPRHRASNYFNLRNFVNGHILISGDKFSYMDELTDVLFNSHLWNLGVNVLIVVALICAVYVSRDFYRS